MFGRLPRPIRRPDEHYPESVWRFSIRPDKGTSRDSRVTSPCFVSGPDQWSAARGNAPFSVPLRPKFLRAVARTRHAALPAPQGGQTLHEGARIPAPAGLQVCEVREGRHRRLERPDLPRRGEVLGSSDWHGSITSSWPTWPVRAVAADVSPWACRPARRGYHRLSSAATAGGSDCRLSPGEKMRPMPCSRRGTAATPSLRPHVRKPLPRAPRRGLLLR